MKITTLTSALLVAGFSTAAFSALPPEAPSIYGNGPDSPRVASTNMSEAEKASYALYEGVMQVAEATIHATSCGNMAGSYPLSIYSNGIPDDGDPEDNIVTVSSLGGQFMLEADPQDPVFFRGQKFKINQYPDSRNTIGKLNGVELTGFKGNAIYNEDNNVLFQNAFVKVMGANGRYENYKGKVIKDFYQGSMGASEYEIIDWGLQTLHKFGYPVNKYWQRSKARRSDGTWASTVFVKDRLVGTTSCRIVISTVGDNNQDIFDQAGKLTISVTDPEDTVDTDLAIDFIAVP